MWLEVSYCFEKFKTLISVLITGKEVMLDILYLIALTTEGSAANTVYK